jgi:uncharacterized protein (DUF4415 family)
MERNMNHSYAAYGSVARKEERIKGYMLRNVRTQTDSFIAAEVVAAMRRLLVRMVMRQLSQLVQLRLDLSHPRLDLYREDMSCGLLSTTAWN